jgi:arylsulfatase A-like enzyme
MDRIRPLLPVVLLAALSGGLYGAAEALAVPIEARLWVENPAALIAAGFALSALLIVAPGAVLGLAGAGRTRGLLGAAAAVTALELVLMFITDPPPFREPPWWMNNPALLGGGLVAVAALLLAGRKVPAVGPVWLGLLCLAPLAGGVMKREASGGGAADRPNLLLITSDTTRADHIHTYGHKRISTPHVDQLAEGGVLFENAFSQIAVTGPSHTTILSGNGTWTHGTLLNGIPVLEEQVLLPERLKEEGWRTGAFVSAYVLESAMGFNRGFGTYDDDFSWLKGSSDLMAARIWAGIKRRLNPDEVLERRGGDTVDSALGWLEANPEGQPWFLWVHLFDPHGPYAPPEPYSSMYYDGDPTDPKHTSMQRVKHVAVYLEDSLEGITDLNYVIAQYDGEISYMDAQVGRLMEALEARGEVDDTVVLFSGDHGESLGENDIWFNHGDDVFDASTHVPLIVRWPGHVPGGKRVKGLVELTDIAPTLYELLGVEAPETLHDGQSLVPKWTEDKSRPYTRSFIFDREANIAARESGEYLKPHWRMVGLRGRSSLFVRREAGDFYDEMYELDDPEKDVIKGWYEDGLKREIIDNLVSVADQLIAAGDAGLTHSTQELTAEQEQKLRDLGYVE